MSEIDLHVPEELEDLHGPEDNVLDRLLANATQRGRVDIPCCLGLLLLLLLLLLLPLLLLLLLRRRRLPTKRRH